MKKRAKEKDLSSLRLESHRNDLIQSGAYDGRYRSRIVQSLKHKDEKHKKRTLYHEAANN
jgi:hypothetical protein